MLTKAQKNKQVEEGKKLLEESGTLIFADFTKTKNEDLRNLRVTLRTVGAKFQVIKKRLLGIIFKEKGIDFNPKEFQGQVGTIFAKGDISEVAGSIYQFSKDKEGFKILGGLNINDKLFIPADIILTIGKLPSKEILLAQLAQVLSSPLRMFMYILQEKGKRS